MTAPVGSTSPGLWQRLPAELRIEILRNMPDLPTLRNLLVASPSDRSLFRRYHFEIWSGTLSNLSNEIRSIVSSVYDRRWCHADKSDSWGSDLRVHVEQNAWPPLETYHFADEITSLFYMAEVTDNIQGFMNSFARRRVLVPSGQPDGQPSPMESDRISRAFWHFYELLEWESRDDSLGCAEESHTPPRYVSSYSRIHADPGKDWLCPDWIHDYPGELFLPPCLRKLPLSEINELDAIRGFLRDEVNSVQLDRNESSSVLEKQPLLIRRLIRDVEYSSTSTNYPSHKVLTVNLGAGPPYVPPYGWTTPNLQWDLKERQANLSPRGAWLIHQQQQSLDKSEQWGWCMWDRDRLSQCGMLRGRVSQRPQEGQTAKTTAWMEKTREAHKRCVALLQTTVDQRIKARFDADVACVKRKIMQCEELKSREQLMTWVRGKDLALYDEWSSLLRSEDFDRVTEEKAELCYSKALLLQRLEDEPSECAGMLSEESDLELLVYYRACK